MVRNIDDALANGGAGTDAPVGADALKLRRPGERFSVLPTV